MRLRIDLHVHSSFSSDSVSSLEVLNAGCRAAGLDGFAVCDHDSVACLDTIPSLRGGPLVVPGLEVSARGAHILCLDPSGLVPARLGVAETVRRIHDQGALAVLAHPYALPRSWVSLGEIGEAGFDAVEVANSVQWPYRLVRDRNRGLAERLGLPATGGSDSHMPSTLGRAYTVVEAEEATVEGVLEAVRRGRTTPVDGSTTWSERLRKLLGAADPG